MYKRQNFIISLSPGPHPWALENYLIDWPKWSRWQGTPTWDEYLPQVYRFNYADFERDWNQQVQFMGSRNKDLIAGIRLTGDGPDAARNEIAKHAELPRQTKSMGHCWWYSKGVLDVFSKEIADFYDVPKLGHAPHLRFGPDHRPKPFVASREGKGRWSAELGPGKYRVIAFHDGTWRQIRVLIVSKPSRQTITADADAVEFLVSRR